MKTISTSLLKLLKVAKALRRDYDGVEDMLPTNTLNLINKLDDVIAECEDYPRPKTKRVKLDPKEVEKVAERVRRSVNIDRDAVERWPLPYYHAKSVARWHLRTVAKALKKAREEWAYNILLRVSKSSKACPKVNHPSKWQTGQR